MREELRNVERILRENDWVMSVPAKEGEMTEYVKAYNDGENVIGIEIALEPCSFGCYGRYGIGCVQLVKYEYEMPYIRDDIRMMMDRITFAENELLDLGVPFRPNYGFGRNLENNLDRNCELREKYHLAEFEKADF